MPSIKKDDINLGIDYCLKNDLFKELNDLYNSIPNGDCIGCGKCCMESVGANLVEFLNIYNYLNENNYIYNIVMEKILDYYFLEYKEKRSCPFKDSSNRCLIYDVRPLNCRIYGHWTKTDYNKNYDRIKKDNIEFAKYMSDEHNIKIEDDILNYKIEYCKKFKPSIDYMNKEERMNYYDKGIVIDSKLYSKGIMDIEFRDRGIVEYFIESIFFNSVASNIRMNITKNNSYKVLKRVKTLVLREEG